MNPERVSSILIKRPPLFEKTRHVFDDNISSSGGPGAGSVSGTWTDLDQQLFVNIDIVRLLYSINVGILLNKLDLTA